MDTKRNENAIIIYSPSLHYRIFLTFFPLWSTQKRNNDKYFKVFPYNESQRGPVFFFVCFFLDAIDIHFIEENSQNTLLFRSLVAKKM